MSFFSRRTGSQTRKPWKPLALRTPVLIFTIVLCWALIAVLQFLLTKSQRESGLIFAPKINDLPLSRTFLYLYFPTIASVVFGTYWNWIDLETKRMEPYYQLSKEDGALGKDSLLLQYPFDFLPLVPLKAFRDRHWPVFWGSLAVVLVTWGLVPTQAGIFSLRTVTRTTNTTFAISTSRMPFAQQSSKLTFQYAQSTYGIVSLNETLPPFMARNYTLAPFKPLNEVYASSEGQGNWTAPTTMYSLGLRCEDASHKSDNTTKIIYRSSGGCKWPRGLEGNYTMGKDKMYRNFYKGYTGSFVGYNNAGNGLAYYSLVGICPESENTTFFGAFTKNKAKAEDPPQDVTAIFCKPEYYRQAVSATVDTFTKRPLRVDPLGDKEVLPWDVFNTEMFESLLNVGTLGSEVRGDTLPAKSLPTYLEIVAKTNLSLTSGGTNVQPMVGLAIATGTRPLEEYLDWKVLSKAYADAYRILFARAMVDVLGSDFRPESTKNAVGQQQSTTEAVVLEPVFVYVIEGFLGVVSIATIALLVLSLLHKRNLRTDPSTIASVMAIVADNEPLLSDFTDLDCCTVEDVKNIVGQKRYKLVDDGSRVGIIEVADHVGSSHESQISIVSAQRRDTPVSIAKPVRPYEFSLWTAFPFVNLFIILSIALGVVFSKARANGLPLPSSNKFGQNLLENYIPTAIATLIEPMWTLINRLLCMLQPLEELQACNTRAKRSIDLNYSSLPPQLVVFKALKSKHFVLAAVCAMGILANILAVAFAGLFNQGVIDMRHPTSLRSIYDLKFVPINGNIGPSKRTFDYGVRTSGAYQGGTGEDQFLVAQSNYTRGTPLPAWTDDTMFYLPFSVESAASQTTPSDGNQFEARTKAFGAELDCTQLEFGKVFGREHLNHSTFQPISANITVSSASGDVRCRTDDFVIRPGPMSLKDFCVTGPSSLEFAIPLEAQVNATQKEKDVCMGSFLIGWLHDAQEPCKLGKGMGFETQSQLLVTCRPKLRTGSANIRVDRSGRLQQKATNLSLDTIAASTGGDFPRDLFSNDSVNLIGQSNQYLFKSSSPGWHNDSFADEFINYFMIRDINSSRLVDPNQALPTFDEVIGPLTRVYSKLFAIWVSINMEQLLVQHDANSAPTLEAWIVQPETRLFVSTPMFVISEVILCIYAIVGVFVYMRRPGQYLARLPTSIASVIALFAASTAVLDMKNTSHLDKKGRARHLEALDSRYGYGSFVGGGDGRVHIGVEKTPFVRFRSKKTWLEKRVPLLRKFSGGS